LPPVFADDQRVGAVALDVSADGAPQVVLKVLVDSGEVDAGISGVRRDL